MAGALSKKDSPPAAKNQKGLKTNSIGKGNIPQKKKCGKKGHRKANVCARKTIPSSEPSAENILRQLRRTSSQKSEETRCQKEGQGFWRDECVKEEDPQCHASTDNFFLSRLKIVTTLRVLSLPVDASTHLALCFFCGGGRQCILKNFVSHCALL